MLATVTSKGQLTLPVEARRRLGIRPGTKLHVVVLENGRLELIPLADSVKFLKGMVPKPPKALTLRDMEDAIGTGSAS